MDRPARSHLLLYALSRCTEEEAVGLEAHVLDCDGCFEDLQALDRAGGLLREFLEPGSAGRARILEALGADTPDPQRPLDRR